MKRLISHVRLLFNIQLVHLFSNTFETARYNMIFHDNSCYSFSWFQSAEYLFFQHRRLKFQQIITLKVITLKSSLAILFGVYVIFQTC